ncbi:MULTISPECIES: protein-L-isoaspartate O-methyltransferase family protein [Halocynthiibacter]|uniref:Protein-L-isoaspartate O-methyltransferase n=1 Tax=Halocynthiibacter halioticoli TaxID=2986804 RepID=A0AAE3J1S7_9RHOB|nr:MULTISPECIES: protein-L-isoaspartate O-methyltransferase [Halocynthiibacter]MCV6825008.1 protein-L-isoaspartate O-methyltransferase [Halocynthiibacter halioticoli]MCW4058009.1 protein-L-isoaspartate O-methyltransferase [Halocynthiibacter sp. SDUM655004]
MTDFSTRRTMMVDTQIRPSDVTKFPIIAAMLEVPREDYVPEELREAAYLDGNIALGEGRVLLEPRTFGKMLDALDIQASDLILDVGCGLGYSTAVLAHMGDTVVGVESDEAQADTAQETLSAGGIDNAAVVAGPLANGAAKHCPYDIIVIEGGIEVLPQSIADQLKDGGRIAALFVEGTLGEVRIGQKTDGTIAWRRAFNADAPVLLGFEKTEEFVL